MFRTTIWALIGAAVSGAVADDVYSLFFGPIGPYEGAPTYDVGNPNCFSIGNNNARQVAFMSNSANSGFDGPYCLSAWAESGCNGDARANQLFQNIYEVAAINLNDGVANGGSYKWATSNC